MNKKISIACLCAMFFVFFSFTYTKANDSINKNQDDLSIVSNYAQENLSKIKDKLNANATVATLNSEKQNKKAYELFGFKDANEVNELKVDKIFKVYSLYQDDLNEDSDLKSLVSPTNTYEVFLGSTKEPKIRVVLSLNKTNNKFKVLEYGEISKQMKKNLSNHKTDENTIMFTTNASDRYLIEDNTSKVIPAISCASDSDELSLKDFAKRNNEQRETGKKMFEEYKSKISKTDSQ